MTLLRKFATYVDVPTAMTLPEVFRKAGYTTLSNGKIFHALDDAAERSWSEAPWLTRNNTRNFDPETSPAPAMQTNSPAMSSPN